MLYNGQEFPKYIFTDKINASIFVEFDIVFIDRDFWKIMKGFLEIKNITSIVVRNLEPNYHFNETIKTNALPDEFVELVQKEGLEGYFDFKANLHMLTNRTLIFPQNEDALCIVLNRDYSIGIIGFTNKDMVPMFNEYAIGDILDYLKINFAGKELPNSFKDELSKNWNL
jgi:hypothetical protein